MPMTNLCSYHWHHRFYWTFFNLACCEVWFQLTRHNESITCWSPVWMNLHTASFLPCCPATIATSPVVNLPVRRCKHQPGTLPWASLHCRCAERIRGLNLTLGSVSDLSFLPVSSGASKKKRIIRSKHQIHPGQLQIPSAKLCPRLEPANQLS